MPSLQEMDRPAASERAYRTFAPADVTPAMGRAKTPSLGMATGRSCHGTNKTRCPCCVSASALEQLERTSDLRRDVILNLEAVVQPAIVRIGPHDEARIGTDQPRGDAQLLA